MAYNGKLLARAREKLERRRALSEAEFQARREEVYARLPAVRDIERELSRLVTGVCIEALQSGKKITAALDGARAKTADLEARRIKLLLGAGYPADYIDEKPACLLCGDSGFVNGQVCACLDRLYGEELALDLSRLPGAGSERFERFDLSYYSSKRDPALGDSPRECMETVIEVCRSYAERFGRESVNLLFQGGTGLGKTYLSVCIARAVATKGFSVVYDTAVDTLTHFENQRFLRGSSESEAAAEQIHRYLHCDLLIVDDLGTEMPGSFSASSLYYLINARIVAKRQMIISTNLGDKDLAQRYTPQIVSRLEGEFLNLSFVGSDIRVLKKERGLA